MIDKIYIEKHSIIIQCEWVKLSFYTDVFSLDDILKVMRDDIHALKHDLDKVRKLYPKAKGE